ncbi:MAG TPA: DMT family transporter [Kofleriaceae bacterium]|nr:DMT family transporter [Kofleriaceae bacterium]
MAANKYTTAANAILIQYSSPAWVALLGAMVLGERASRVDWLTIAGALVGVTLFFFERLTFDHTAGNLLALAAGVAFAAHAVLLRRLALLGLPTLRAVTLGHVMAAVLGAPAVLGAGALPWSALLALLALGVLQQAVPGLLYAWAIRRVTALEGMLIPTIEPVLSPMWVWLAFREAPSGWALVGGALVLAVVTARAVVALRVPPRYPARLSAA